MYFFNNHNSTVPQKIEQELIAGDPMGNCTLAKVNITFEYDLIYLLKYLNSLRFA